MDKKFHWRKDLKHNRNYLKCQGTRQKQRMNRCQITGRPHVFIEN